MRFKNCFIWRTLLEKMSELKFCSRKARVTIVEAMVSVARLSAKPPFFADTV